MEQIGWTVEYWLGRPSERYLLSKNEAAFERRQRAAAAAALAAKEAADIEKAEARRAVLASRSSEDAFHAEQNHPQHREPHQHDRMSSSCSRDTFDVRSSSVPAIALSDEGPRLSGRDRLSSASKSRLSGDDFNAQRRSVTFGDSHTTKAEDAAIAVGSGGGSGGGYAAKQGRVTVSERRRKRKQKASQRRKHNDELALKAYHQVTSVEEEAEQIIEEIHNIAESNQRGAFKQFKVAAALATTRAKSMANLSGAIAGDVEGYFKISSTSAATAVFHTTDTHRARYEALYRNMGINGDGSPVRLTAWEWLVYGSPRNKLMSLLREARRKCSNLEATIEGLSADDQTIVLFQAFITHQLSTFKRFILQQQGYHGDRWLTAGLVDPFAWLLSWLAIIAIFGFLFYWVFAWGLSSGNAVFYEWGVNFAVSMVQELFFIQLVRVLLLNTLSMAAVRPQLQNIYHALSLIAVTIANAETEPAREVASASPSVTTDPLNVMGGYPQLHTPNIPQGHYYHNPDVSTEPEIEDAEVAVYEEQEFSTAQHLQPACRAARLQSVRRLPAAKVLRCVDDLAVQQCHAGSKPLGLIVLVFLAVPITLALLNESVGDAMIDVILPGVFAAIVLLHSYLLGISILVMLTPLIAIVVYFYLKRQRKLARRKKQRRFAELSQATGGGANEMWDRQQYLLRVQQQQEWRESARRLAAESWSISSVATSCLRAPSRAVRTLLLLLRTGAARSAATEGAGNHPEEQEMIERRHLLQWSNMNRPFMEQAHVPESRTVMLGLQSKSYFFKDLCSVGSNSTFAPSEFYKSRKLLFGSGYGAGFSMGRSASLGKGMHRSESWREELLMPPDSILDMVPGSIARDEEAIRRQWQVSAAEEYLTALMNKRLFNTAPLLPTSPAMPAQLIKQHRASKSPKSSSKSDADKESAMAAAVAAAEMQERVALREHNACLPLPHEYPRSKEARIFKRRYRRAADVRHALKIAMRLPEVRRVMQFQSSAKTTSREAYTAAAVASSFRRSQRRHPRAGIKGGKPIGDHHRWTPDDSRRTTGFGGFNEGTPTEVELSYDAMDTDAVDEVTSDLDLYAIQRDFRLTELSSLLRKTLRMFQPYGVALTEEEVVWVLQEFQSAFSFGGAQRRTVYFQEFLTWLVDATAHLVRKRAAATREAAAAVGRELLEQSAKGGLVASLKASLKVGRSSGARGHSEDNEDEGGCGGEGGFACNGREDDNSFSGSDDDDDDDDEDEYDDDDYDDDDYMNNPLYDIRAPRIFGTGDVYPEHGTGGGFESRLGGKQEQLGFDVDNGRVNYSAVRRMSNGREGDGAPDTNHQHQQQHDWQQ